MKKIIFLIFTIITITIFSTSILGAEDVQNSAPLDQENIVESNTEDDTIQKDTTDTTGTTEDDELSGASKEIIEAIDEKDKKIANLTLKYNNDEALATVAYYLEQVRYYSTPIFFIFLTIGAFNFFIIGNKKLDKKEQGFGWITACIIGWVIFQCIPLAFTLFAI